MGVLNDKQYDFSAAVETPATPVSPYSPPETLDTPSDLAISQPAESVGQYMQDVYSQSADQVALNWAMYGALKGEANYEDVQHVAESSAVSVARAQRISAYRKLVPQSIQAQAGQWLQDVALESVPQLADTAVKGGLAGAGVGAALGVMGGPFAGVTIPGGAATGFMLGTASSAAMNMAGAAYAAIRARGVSHDAAVPYAISAGIFEGGTMVWRLESLPKFLVKPFQAAIASTGGHAAKIQFVSRFLADSGQAGLQGAAQSAIETLAEYEAAIHNNGKPPTFDEGVQAAAKAAAANMALGTGLHLTGAASGAAFKTVMGHLVKQHVGEPIQASVSIDVAAAEAKVNQSVSHASDLRSIYQTILNKVDEYKGSGQNVPPALWQAYNDAHTQLKQAEAKASQDIAAHDAAKAFGSLSADERLKTAEADRVAAENRLSTIQYEIGEIEDHGDPVPQSLRSARKQARIDLRIATERKRQAELEIEREAIDEKLANKETGEGVKLAASKARNRIDNELHRIKVSEAERLIDKRESDAKAELQNVKDELAIRQTENANAIQGQINKHPAANHPEYRNTPEKLAAFEAFKARARENVYKANPVDALEVKQAKLTKEIESIHDLFEILNDLTPTEINNLVSKLPSVRIDALANSAKRLVGQVATEAAKSAVSEAKRETALVDKVIRLSGLTQAEQAKLKAFKPGITRSRETGETTNNLQSYLQYLDERVKELVDKRETTEAKETLAKAVKRTEPSLVNKTLRGLPEVQAVLSTYRDFIENPEHAETILDAPITEGDVLKEPELGAVHPLTQKAIAAEVLGAITPEKINDLAEHIEQIAQKGLDAKLEAAAKFREKLDNGKTLIKQALSKDSPKAHELLNPIEKAARSGRELVMAPWNALTEVILQYSDNEAARAWLDVRRAVDAEKSGVTKMTDRMFELLTSDDAKLKAVLIEGYAKKYRKDAPHEDLKNVSDDQLMRLLGLMNDPTLKSRLVKGNGFTLLPREGERLSTKQWVEKQLSPEQRLMVQKMGAFYREAYKEANEAHIQRFNYPLEDNPNYAGPAQALLEDTTTNDFLKALVEQRSVAPGFLKRKIENINPIPLDTGMLETGQRYVRQLQHFIEWTRPEGALPGVADRLQAVFSDRDIQKRITHLYGQKTYDMVETAYKDITGLKPIIIERIPFIGELVKSVGNVIHSPFQLIKQSTGVLMYLKYIGVKDLATGAYEVATNFEKYGPLFASMKFIKAREASKYSVLEARLANTRRLFGDNAIKNGIMLLQEIQSFPLQIADAANIYLGGGALYIRELRNGATPEAAEAFMAKASVETQGSSLPDQRTHLERNAFGAMLSQFSKPAVQAHFAAANDVRHFLAKPTLKNFHQALASSVAVRAAETAFVAAGAAPALFTAFMLASNGDEKKLDRVTHDFLISEFLALTFGPATGLPNLSNQMINLGFKAVLNEATHGQAHEYETQIPVLEMATSGISFAKETAAVASGNKEPTREETFTILRAFNRSVLMGTTGLNLDPLIGTTRFLLDVSESADERRERKREDGQAHKETVANR